MRQNGKNITCLLFLPLLLFSCESPSSSNPQERSYTEPTGGTYDPNRKFKESSPVDLLSLGLSKDIDEIVQETPLPLRSRTDGTLDPFGGKKPNELGYSYFEDEPGYSHITCDFSASLFDDRSYVFQCGSGWYVDISNPKQGSYPCFYDWFGENKGDPSLSGHVFSSPGGPVFDCVYSHGAWSYIANFAHISIGPTKEAPYALFNQFGWNIIWGFKHCTLKDYPYTVYFDTYHVYFMTKDKAFPNDYLDAFNKVENMHLLYA